MEKHFPAPDRNRIQRLLGLEPPKLKLDDDYLDGAGGSGGNKRKPVRQAAQRASKKVRAWSSEEEISDEEKNGAHSSGSEFKLTGSESEDDHHTDEESNISSDFNPFYTDSDSETGKYRNSSRILQICCARTHGAPFRIRAKKFYAKKKVYLSQYTKIRKMKLHFI